MDEEANAAVNVFRRVPGPEVNRVLMPRNASAAVHHSHRGAHSSIDAHAHFELHLQAQKAAERLRSGFGNHKSSHHMRLDGLVGDALK